MEILVNNQNEPPTLLKQTSRPQGRWIILKLEGAAERRAPAAEADPGPQQAARATSPAASEQKTNRSAIGARVLLKTGERIQMQEVRSGGSYLSQGDLRLQFGLGQAETIDQITIAWPSGRQQTLTAVRPNQIHTIHEPAQK